MFSVESNITRYDWISPCKPGDFERKISTPSKAAVIRFHAGTREPGHKSID
jgi:hypothetical protein